MYLSIPGRGKCNNVDDFLFFVTVNGKKSIPQQFESATALYILFMENSEYCRLRLDRSTALYIYKAKNSKLLAILNHAQKQNLYLNNI